MRRPKRSSLYWRLLPSYLLVILVAAGTAFLAGEAVAPFFLQRHVDVMMDTLHTHADQSLDEMADDLEAGFRRALTQSLLWRSEERRVGKESSASGSTAVSET